MADTCSVGDIRKLDGQVVFVVAERGPAILVDRDWPWSERSTVHEDQLSECTASFFLDDESELKRLAAKMLAKGPKTRRLASLALRLLAAYQNASASEKHVDDVTVALQDEGKALDETARELEQVRAELAEGRAALCKHNVHAIPLPDLIRMVVETLDDRTANLTIRTEERNEARTKLEMLHSERHDAVKVIADELVKLKIYGFELNYGAPIDEAARMAASAVREFGILNRELHTIDRALQPVAHAGESVSETVRRIVDEVHTWACAHGDVGRERDDVRRELSNVRHELANALQSNDVLAQERDMARSEVNRLHAQIIRMENDRQRSEAIAEMAPPNTPTTRTFTKTYLRDTLELPMCAEETRLVGHTRWALLKECVFRTDESDEVSLPEGYFWQAQYSVGATEKQDERPWQYVDEVQCTLVRRGKKTVDAWLPAVMPSNEPQPDGAEHVHEPPPVELPPIRLCDKSCVLVDNHDGACLGPNGNELFGIVMAAESTTPPEVLAAMNDDVHVPNDEHMSTVHESMELSIADMSTTIATTTKMGSDESALATHVFRASAHAQLAEPSEPLSPCASRVLDWLRGKGPTRGEQIRKALGMGSSDWERARCEIVARNMVTVEGEKRSRTYEVRS